MADFPRGLSETITFSESLVRTQVLGRGLSEPGTSPRISDNFDVDSDSIRWDNEDWSQVSPTAGIISFSGGEKIFTSINNSDLPFGHTSKHKYLIIPGMRYSQEMTIDNPTDAINVALSISTVPAILNPFAGTAIAIFFKGGGNKIELGLPGTNLDSGFTWQNGVKYTVALEIKPNGDIHYLIQGGLFTTETLIGTRILSTRSDPSIVGTQRYINTLARDLEIGGTLKIDNFQMIPDQQGNLLGNAGLDRQLVVDGGHPTEGIQGYLWSLKNLLTLEKDTFDIESDFFPLDCCQHDLFFKTGLWDDEIVNGAIQLLNSIQFDTLWNDSESFIFNDVTTEGTVSTVSGEKVFDNDAGTGLGKNGTVNDVSTSLVLEPGTEITLDVKQTFSANANWLIGISTASSLGVNKLDVTGFFSPNVNFNAQQESPTLNGLIHMDDLSGDLFSSGVPSRTIPVGTFMTFKWVVLSDGRVRMFSDLKDGRGFVRQGTSNLIDSVSMIGAQFFHINIGDTLGSGEIIVDNFFVTNHTKELSKTSPAWNETGMKLTDKVDAVEDLIFETEVSTDSLIDASVNLQHLNQITMETGWAFRFRTTPVPPPAALLMGELELLFDGVVLDTISYNVGDRYKLKFLINEDDDVQFWIQSDIDFPEFTLIHTSSDRAPISNLDDLRISSTLFSDTGNFYIHEYKNEDENSGWLDFENTSEIGGVNFVDPARVNTTGISVKSGEKILDRRGSVTSADDGFDRFYTRRKNALVPSPGQIIEIDFLQETLGDSALLYVSELGEDSVLDPSANLTGIETSVGGVFNFWDGSSGTPTAISYQANLFYRIRFYYNDDGTVRVTILGNEHATETDIGTSTIVGSGNWLERPNYFFLNTATAGIFYKLKDYSLTHPDTTWNDISFSKGKTFTKFANPPPGNFGHSNTVTFPTGDNYEFEIRWATTLQTPNGAQFIVDLGHSPNLFVNKNRFNVGSVNVDIQDSLGDLFNEASNVNVFHTYMFKALASGEVEYYIDSILKATSTDTPNLNSGNIHMGFQALALQFFGPDAFLIDRVTVRNEIGSIVYEDDFTTDTGDWTDFNTGAFTPFDIIGDIRIPPNIHEIIDEDFVKKFITPGDFGLDTTGSIRTETFDGVPGTMAKIDFLIHKDPDETNINVKNADFLFGLQDGNSGLDVNETVGILVEDFMKQGPLDVGGVEKNLTSVSATQTLQKDILYTIRVYLDDADPITASFTIQGGSFIDEFDLGTTTFGISGDYREDLLAFVIHANGMYRNREGFLKVGEGQSYDLVRERHDYLRGLAETIQTIDAVKPFKNKVCIDSDNFNGSLAAWNLNQTDGTVVTNGGFLEISRTVAASFDDLGLLRIFLTEGRARLIWELDVKFDSTNSEVLFGVTQEAVLDRTEEVGIFFDDDGNVKIRDKGSIIGSQAYAADVWYTIRIFEDGTGALEGTIQGGAYPSETTIGTSTTLGFDDDTLQYRLAINARKLNLNDGNDLVFVENYDLCRPFGLVTRELIENIPLINNRVGVSVGVFLKADSSALVTGNTEIRLMDRFPDSGEIAHSGRLNSGPFKFLRYVPGTDNLFPNNTDLLAIPTDPGNQGWILDDSPAGVLLRGEYTLKVIVSDTLAEGQIRIHANIFTVTHTVSGVQKVLKIGITQVTAPFTPAVGAIQHILNWTQEEAGETFINTDESLYVEIFIEELANPSLNARSIMRLADPGEVLFSQFAFPGVTDEPTFSEVLPSETITIADFLNSIVGFVRELTENIPPSDILDRNIGFDRQLVEDISPVVDTDLNFGINVLFETIGPIIDSSLNRQVDYIRPFIESIPISDTLDVSGSTTKIFQERIVIRDEVNAFVTRPPRQPNSDGINKRRIDGIVSQRLLNVTGTRGNKS